MRSSAVQQNCCWDRNTLKLPSPTQQSLATLGNGALETCQGDRGTEFSLYLTLVYLNLNKHKQLEAKGTWGDLNNYLALTHQRFSVGQVPQASALFKGPGLYWLRI